MLEKITDEDYKLLGDQITLNIWLPIKFSKEKYIIKEEQGKYSLFIGELSVVTEQSLGEVWKLASILYDNKSAQHESHMTGLVEKARSYAIAVHGAAAQTYSGIYPYTYHLLQVYKLTKSYAKKLNFTEEETTVACSIAWLHDTIEDARITYGDLTSNKFPNIIAEGVRALTQNPRGRTRAERADAEYYNNIVIHKIFLLVKLCDTMANASFSESVGSKMYLKYREEIPKTIDTYNLETIYNNQLSDIVKQLKNI